MVGLRAVGRIGGWAVPVCLALAFAMVVAQQTPVRAVRAGLDEPLPAFALRPLAGQPITAESLRGRPALIYVWAAWSGLANAEAAMMERLWQDYGRRGVTVVGVAAFDRERTRENNARALVRRHRLTFPNGVDEDGRISEALRVVDVPERILVDARGRIVGRQSGPADDAALRRALDALLSG